MTTVLKMPQIYWPPTEEKTHTSRHSPAETDRLILMLKLPQTMIKATANSSRTRHAVDINPKPPA